MPNRLEQEFPPINWMPTRGPVGGPPEIIWSYVACGRRLRHQAFRESARAAGMAVARASLGAVALLRRMARRPAPPGRQRLTVVRP